MAPLVGLPRGESRSLLADLAFLTQEAVLAAQTARSCAVRLIDWPDVRARRTASSRNPGGQGGHALGVRELSS